MALLCLVGLGACGGATPGAKAPVDAAPEVNAEVAVEVAMETVPETVPEAAMETAGDVDPACATIQPDATRMVHLRITTDNECEVFVNGDSVGTTTSWPSPVTIDVSLFVHPGLRNVITVRGTNVSSQAGNDRGILGELAAISDGVAMPVVVTDGAWRTSKVEEGGWTDSNFDDGAWAPATVVASHGDPPWGALLGTSTAKWIWSAPVPDAVADKPNQETAFARRAFYFTTDGAGITSTPGCPTPTVK